MNWKLKKIKKRYFKRKILTTQIKIWDLEFLLEQIKETREGVRREHDRIVETLDASKRRLWLEKYTFHYGATGDAVDVMNLPLPYSDIEKLPDKPSQEFRFYKVPKEDPDKTICENMQKMIDKFSPDVEQMKKQMDALDGQINNSWQTEGDGGVLHAIESHRTVIDMLKKYVKTL